VCQCECHILPRYASLNMFDIFVCVCACVTVRAHVFVHVCVCVCVRVCAYVYVIAAQGCSEAQYFCQGVRQDLS